jgi:hypothetical protein
MRWQNVTKLLYKNEKKIMNSYIWRKQRFLRVIMIKLKLLKRKAWRFKNLLQRQKLMDLQIVDLLRSLTNGKKLIRRYSTDRKKKRKLLNWVSSRLLIKKSTKLRNLNCSKKKVLARKLDNSSKRKRKRLMMKKCENIWKNLKRKKKIFRLEWLQKSSLESNKRL